MSIFTRVRVQTRTGAALALMGASPGMTGSARGQSQLRQAFVFTNSYALPQPEMLVAHAQEKFDSQGILTDASTRDFLRRLLGGLAEWAARFWVAPAMEPPRHT